MYKVRKLHYNFIFHVGGSPIIEFTKRFFIMFISIWLGKPRLGLGKVRATASARNIFFLKN